MPLQGIKRERGPEGAPKKEAYQAFGTTECGDRANGEDLRQSKFTELLM